MPVRLMPRPAPDEMLTMRPQPACFHAGRHRLRHQERAGEVDVEDGLPLAAADLLDRTPDLSEHAAGVVDQDVDVPSGGVEFRHQRRQWPPRR